MTSVALPAQSTPDVSVIVCTYNRHDSLGELLEQLGQQSIPPTAYEVVVVDDGSDVPVAEGIASRTYSYPMTVIRQPNGGPAVARHAGILRARGDLVVLVDDDMRVHADFLCQHLAAHATTSHCVVLGRLRPDPHVPLELFDRSTMWLLDKLAARAKAGTPPTGLDLYSGNVSFRRADYLDVGGFDPSFRLSEDAELGLRLENAGAAFALSDGASAFHASDHTSVGAWMRRAIAYGVADARVAAKHPTRPAADPWRFLFRVHRVSRPFMLTAVMFPTLTRPLAWAAMGVALGLDRLGVERMALAGTTFVYGLQYFAGVRAAAGSRRRALSGLRRYLNGAASADLGIVGRTAKCAADIRGDQEAMQRSDDKYGSGAPQRSIVADSVHRIGFQMMICYRLIRLCRDLRLGLFARIGSRMMRHVYGAELHWEAELAPGVTIVHGTGLVVSHAARVGTGCILFQHVTLGESMHPDTRVLGAPTLEANVHVAPGATVLGPITIGEGAKIGPGAIVTRSVPPRSVVEAAQPIVRARGSASADRPAHQVFGTT